MLTFPIAEARAQFSQVLKQVEAGEEVGISRGKGRETIAVIIPFPAWEETKQKKKKRKLGTLAHWRVTISDDWKMTDEDFLNLPVEPIPADRLALIGE